MLPVVNAPNVKPWKKGVKKLAIPKIVLHRR
jgi:hypothetical protein